MSNSRYKLFIEKTRGLEDKIRNYKSYVVKFVIIKVML